MLHLRPVVVTVLLGLLMTMTQAPVQAAIIGAPAPTATPTPMANELFSLHGELGQPIDPARNLVYLQRLDSGTWRTVTSKAPINAAVGSYSFSLRIGTPTSFRVTAYTTTDTVVSATRYVRVARQYVAASIERVCDNNHDCGTTAKVVGQVSPTRAGRRVVLQYRSGSSWKALSVKGYTAADGTFETPAFSIASWSQWSVKQFRVAAASFAGSTVAVSAPISFMPGPKNLGDNVLRIDVAGGSFPSTKGVDYTGYATLTRLGTTSINRARLDKFGVRGSTTAGYPKKPYNLRFAAAPGSDVFGMDEDRRWTLLAMYADQSYVREKTALDLGRKLAATGKGMTWNPDSRYVELFVNSLYMGAYLMAEKVDIDGDRVAVDQDTGMIMEVDMDKVSDPRKGFKAARSGLVFAFKEPDSLGGSEGITPGKLSAIKNKVAAVESYLYTSNRSYYRSLIDRDSAADFHLAVEFFKDIDSDFWRSKYFSWDTVTNSCGVDPRLCDGKLHFGPLWDFDKSIGNVDATNPGTAFTRSYRGWQANGTGVPKANRVVTFYTHWFVQLWKVPSFRSYLAYRWNNDIRGEFYKAAKYDVDQNRAEIGWGAINDRYRWAGHAKLFQPKGTSYSDEVQYVKSWLLNRFSWMDSQL